MFSLSHNAIDPAQEAKSMKNARAGAFVAFEGWVRDHNDGHPVEKLAYEAYEPMAVSEGVNLLEEAKARFAISEAKVVHRLGPTKIGDLAVWVGVTAEHRQEAFLASRWIMDEIKLRIPIWKKEAYRSSEPTTWIHTSKKSHGQKPSSRYARQLKLPNMGEEAQSKLSDSKVVVVGAGGLGCPALQYLAAAGVGNISILDGDTVELTNLHRQILFGDSDIGKNKAEAAAHHLRKLNPEISIRAIPDAAYADTFAVWADQADLVLDCTDGFESKYLLHDICWNSNTPLLQASVHQFDGWIHLIDPQAGAGCYRCQWPKPPPIGCIGTCSEAGVLGVTPGTLGVMQAAQAISFLSGNGSPLSRSTLYIDILSGETHKISRMANPECDCQTSKEFVITDPQVLLPGKKANLLIKEAILIDLREAEEKANDPDWITAFHSYPNDKWNDIRQEISDQPVILCCAGGTRARKCLQQLNCPEGIFAWGKGIYDLPFIDPIEPGLR